MNRPRRATSPCEASGTLATPKHGIPPVVTKGEATRKSSLVETTG